MSENNNNQKSDEEKKDLLFLKRQIEKVIAQQLSENISGQTIEAVAQSHLPLALEENIKGHLARIMQSFAEKLTYTPLFASILPLKMHVSAKGNFVFTTKKDVSEIGIYTAQGKELGHCLGYRDNPPIAISDNEQYYAFPTDHKTVTIFELPGLNEVDAIKVDDAKAIKTIKISHNGNYVVFANEAFYGSLLGLSTKFYIHDVRSKKTSCLDLFSDVRAIELSDDEKYLGVVLSRTSPGDRFIWLLDQKKIERYLNSKTDALAFHPIKKVYATYEENGAVFLSDFDQTRKIFQLEEVSICTLSFDPTGDYLIAQCRTENPDTTQPDRSTVSIFSVPQNKMIKNAVLCDCDSPVSIIGDSVLIKDHNKLVVHSLKTDETRILSDDFKSIVVSKDGKIAIIQDHFIFYATKLLQELPSSLKLHEILGLIKKERENAGSGAALKEIEKKSGKDEEKDGELS